MTEEFPDMFSSNVLSKNKTTVNYPVEFSISPPLNNTNEGTPVGPTYVTTLLALLAIVFNVVTVAAVCKIKGKLAANIRLVCSLVGADIIASVVNLLESCHEIHFVSSSFYMKKINLQMHSRANCFRIATSALIHIAHNASLLSISCLGIDIFIAIIYPLNYIAVMSKSRVNILLVVVWAISVIFGLFPVIYQVNSFKITKESVKCKNGGLITSEHVTLVILVLSVLVLTFVYTNIFWQIHRMQHDPTRSVRSHQNNVRGMVTTLAILFIFLGCFLPRYISQYINMQTTDMQTEKYPLIDWGVHLRNLSLIHGILDPLIYAYRLRDIKQGYQNLFGITRKRQHFSTLQDKRGVSSIGDHPKKRSYELAKLNDRCLKRQVNNHESLSPPSSHKTGGSNSILSTNVYVSISDQRAENSLLEESLISNTKTEKGLKTVSIFRTLSLKISKSLQFPTTNEKTLKELDKRYSYNDLEVLNKSKRFSFDFEEFNELV